MDRCNLFARALLPIALLVTTAHALGPVRIDDTTVLDPVTGRTYTMPADEPSPAGAPPVGPPLRALTDGFAGCSTTDNCAPFDLVTHVSGPAFSLLPEGDYPYDATLDPAGTELWIPGASGDGVVVIDRATNTITHRIAVGDYPVSVAFSNDGALALVACRGTQEIKIIDTAAYAVTDSLPVPTTYLGAGNITLDPTSGRFYLVDWYGDDLYEIAPDGSAILNQVTRGSSLWQLVVSPDGQTVYVTDRATDEVRIIDRATLAQVGSYPVGDDPWGLDITADGAKLVVTCEDTHNAYVIDTGSGITVPVALDPGADPRDVDILDDARAAFVAGGSITGGHPVFVIDLTTDTLSDTFLTTGSNVNVVAVQAQRVGGGVGAPVIATGTASLTAHPNPFRPLTRIRYSLDRAASVRLVVVDVSGRVVRRLGEGPQEAGPHETIWNGRDDDGRPAAAGVYFVRLDADGLRSSRSLVRMR